MSDRKPTPRARKPARETKPPLTSTNGLAVASLVCALGGVTLIPVVAFLLWVALTALFTEPSELNHRCIHRGVRRNRRRGVRLLDRIRQMKRTASSRH